MENVTDATTLSDYNEGSGNYKTPPIGLYLFPVVGALGFFGNILTVAVMLRKPFRYSAMGVYLIGLAIPDTFIVIFLFPITWLTNFGIIFDSLHIVTCKVWAFVGYFFPAMSAWILVTITFERCVSVALPMQGWVC